MDSRIRSNRANLLGVLLLVATVAAPVMMLASFPWVTRAQVARVIGVMPAEAAQPMVFEGETITLAETDAADAVSHHRCEPATDEAGVPTAVAEAPRFVPLCDQRVGPIGDLAVAANR